MLEEIRNRHKQDEIEFNKVSKGLVHQDRGHLLSLIDRYEKAIKETLEECEHCDVFEVSNVVEILNSALEDK